MRTLRISAASLLIFASGLAAAADAPSPMLVSAPTDAAACAGAGALARIKQGFAWAERNTWRRGFVIESIDNPRPSGHSYSEPGLVRRDYCVADSVMTDGSAHQIYYAIEHGLGFVGLGSDIDFCVPGLDPWHVHDGDCRTVQ